MLAPSDPASGPAARPTTLVLVLGGELDRRTLDALCVRARALSVAADAELIVCDLGSATADGVSIDAIARLKLSAEREGRSLRFVHATRELGELLRFVGLDDVLELEKAELTVDPQG